MAPITYTPEERYSMSTFLDSVESYFGSGTRDSISRDSFVYITELVLNEQHLYGSSRLGMIQHADTFRNIYISHIVSIDSPDDEQRLFVYGVDTYYWDSLYTHQRGSKVYEGTNHLGNVLVTFSDKRLTECHADTIYRYVADVKSQTDYSAFGVLLEERQWYSNNDTNSAIYGFNGMRKDNEIYGSGNAYDFGARIYDPRRGQWASVDPLAGQYPSTSHYVAFGNNPIIYVDPNGKENVIYLVFLPSADNKLTLQDAINIQNQANKNFENLGLETRVVLVDNSLTGGKEFDARKMDRTDALAVLGTRENVIDFVLQQNRRFGEKLCNGWKGGWSHPEESENSPESGYNLGQGGGNIIALDANGVKANEAGVDGKTHSERIMKYGAFLINHGAGHNAGQGHEGQNTNSVIMATGKEVKFRLSYPKSSLPRIEDFTNNEPLPFDESTKRNQEYVNAIEDRFGVEDYKVNYKP